MKKQEKNVSNLTWGVKSEITDGKAYDAPRLIEYQNKLYAFWGESTEAGVMYFAEYDAITNHFNPKNRVGNTLDYEMMKCWETPALSVYEDKLCIAWHRYGTNEIYYTTFKEGIWERATKMEGLTITPYKGVVLCAVGTKNILLFAKDDNAPFMTYLENGVWTTPVRLPYKIYTWYSVSMEKETATTASVYWEDKGNIWTAKYDEVQGWLQESNMVINNAGTNNATAAAKNDGTMYLAWAKDKQIYFSYRQQDWNTPQKVTFFSMPAQVDRAPSLAIYNGVLYMTWVWGNKIHFSKYESKDYNMVFLSDVHVTGAPPTKWEGRGNNSRNFLANETFVEAVNTKLQDLVLNGEKVGPANLVMIGGDLTYSEGSEYTYIDNFSYIFNKLKMPYFACTGNHDTVQSNWDSPITRRNRQRCEVNGKYPYSFEFKGTHYIVLKTDDHIPGGVDWECLKESVYFVKEDLKTLSKETPIVLMLHYGFDDVSLGWTKEIDRKALIEALEGYNLQMILSGHSHYPEIINVPYTTKGIKNYVGGASDYMNMNVFWLFQVRGGFTTATKIGWRWYDGELTVLS